MKIGDVVLEVSRSVDVSFMQVFATVAVRHARVPLVPRPPCSKPSQTRQETGDRRQETGDRRQETGEGVCSA